MDARRIDKEAAHWVAKQIGGVTAEEQDLFFEWLAADPRHGEWYSRHRKTWKAFDPLVQWKPEHSDKPNQDLLKCRKAAVSWSWLGGLAAALALGFFAWQLAVQPMPHGIEPMPDSLVANEYESHLLADGSVVELNRGAALKMDFTPEMRRVELVSSEAHFNVAKDPSRPFVVSVRGIEVRAVGTAFNVRLEGDLVEVLVTEGRVRMRSGEAGLEEASQESHSFDSDIRAGQLSVVSLASESPQAEVFDASIEDMNRLLSWKPELLDFDSTALSEVVLEFNQRNQTQVVIGDESLREIPIVASFRSSNVEHFIELLELTIGVRVEFDGEARVVLREP